MEVLASSLLFPKSFPGRTTLTGGDRVILRAVAEAMFSEDGEVDRARIDGHLEEIDAFISAASRPVRLGLRLALLVVRLAPLLLFFRAATIERLPLGERVTVLSRLERSGLANLSLAFIGWRTVMTLVFYEHPDELARVGYASDERKVYRRHLALVATAAAPATAPVTAPVTPLLAPFVVPLLAPPPEESGVRLRGSHVEAPDSEAVEATEAEKDRVA